MDYVADANIWGNCNNFRSLKIDYLFFNFRDDNGNNNNNNRN